MSIRSSIVVVAVAAAVGLLVYGSGPHWGTAYLGSAGRAPDSAGTLVATPGAAAGPAYGPEPTPAYAPEPEPAYEPEPAFDRGPEVIDLAAGESLLTLTTAFEVVQLQGDLVYRRGGG